MSRASPKATASEAVAVSPPAVQPMPWQAAAFARLCETAAARGAAAVQLLCAADHTGVRQFADAYTGWLLCPQPTKDDGGLPRACGQCTSCRQWRAGSHPDSLRLQPEESREITVEQVRDCIERISLASHYRSHRVVQVEPAERLNRNAANALLKTLEEAPEGTVFLLLTAQPRLLPATVRSRAQLLHLRSPTDSESLAWLQTQLDVERAAALLQQHPGEPLRALAAADAEDEHALFADALNQWQSQPGQLVSISRKLADSRERCEAFLDWLLTSRWQQARHGLGAGSGNAGTADPVIAESVAVHQLGMAARAALQANTSPQLVVEQLLIGWRAWRGRSSATGTATPPLR